MAVNKLAETIDITDEEMASLTSAIHQRHGIDFTCYEQTSLKRRIIRVLHVFQFNSIHELWTKILKDRSFIYLFMDEVSVGLTAMFRDPVLWRKLKQLLSTGFFNGRDLSIWHAGCSSGEEVYTMGVVLKETSFPKPINAVATDISKSAMAIAKKGTYDGLKLADYEKNYKAFNAFGTLKKYFSTLENGDGVMDSQLINHVTFNYHNLITGDFNARYDIVFCRNVMIYFDNTAKLKLFEKFYSCLNENGLLIIGFYDAVLPLIDEKKFKILDIDAKIFQKKNPVL